jgi:hypothetical protein
MGPVVDTFAHAVPGALTGRPGTLCVRITGAVEREWCVSEHGFVDGRVDGRVADDYVEIDAEEFWRQCTAAPSEPGDGSLSGAFGAVRAIIV